MKNPGMAYIRDHYGVPAKRGGIVWAKGKRGVIVGSQGSYLRVRLDGDTHIGTWHPTWRIDYEIEDDKT